MCALCLVVHLKLAPYLAHLVQSEKYVVVSDSLDMVYHPVHERTHKVHLGPSNLGLERENWAIDRED